MRVRSPHRRFFRLAAFLCFASALLYSFTTGCGGLSPPAGIPAPVSNLMTATNPDLEGTVALIGAPGSVLPNALVSAANASQGAIAKLHPLERLLWGISLAQTPDLMAQTMARADGSFLLSLQGDVGETLQVTQTVAGEKSPPTDLTIKGSVIDLGVAAEGVAVDESSSTAYVVGGGNGDGWVFSLDLSRTQPLLSLPDPFLQLAGLPDASAIAIDSNAGTGLAIAPTNHALVVFSLLNEGIPPRVISVNSPLTIATLPERNLAAIGVQSFLTSVSIHDSLDGSFECSFLIPHSSTTASGGHVRTPFVKLAESAENRELVIVAVSEYSDGAWIVSRTILSSCFVSPIPAASVLLPSGVEPGGLGILSGGERAFVSDTHGGQLFTIDFSSNQTSLLAVGPQPQGVTVDELNGRVFIVNSGDNSITLLTLADLQTRKLVGIGLSPFAIGIDRVLKRGLLLSDLDETVVIVDLDFTL